MKGKEIIIATRMPNKTSPRIIFILYSMIASPPSPFSSWADSMSWLCWLDPGLFLEKNPFSLKNRLLPSPCLMLSTSSRIERIIIERKTVAIRKPINTPNSSSLPTPPCRKYWYVDSFVTLLKTRVSRIVIANGTKPPIIFSHLRIEASSTTSMSELESS